MLCKSRGSHLPRKFRAEINIHLPGPKAFTCPTVPAFPEILVVQALLSMPDKMWFDLAEHIRKQ